MTQLHTIHHGLSVVRATNDVDIVLHIEIRRGVPAAVASALEGLGYRLLPGFDERHRTAHRFVRGASTVDLVASGDDSSDADRVDVLIADHAAPRVVERLRGHEMVRLEGGTQALRRTLDARLRIVPGVPTTVSVPDLLGALVLKAAAHTSDTRDRDRHLFDAAALLACIDDPFAERARFSGSDRRRLAALASALPREHPAWRALPPEHREQARLTLDLLTSGDSGRR